MLGSPRRGGRDLDTAVALISDRLEAADAAGSEPERTAALEEVLSVIASVLSGTEPGASRGQPSSWRDPDPGIGGWDDRVMRLRRIAAQSASRRWEATADPADRDRAVDRMREWRQEAEVHGTQLELAAIDQLLPRLDP